MKRIFLLFALLVCASLTSASADDNTLALQTKLQRDGFYFGAADGNYDSNTAAAVTRYQIRHGLPISGQLDGATAKSLGVTPLATAAATPPPESKTWQGLRKPDRKFLAQINARPSPTPPPRQESTPPPAPSTPPDEATFTLSAERLRDYIAAFVLAGLDPQIGAELEFFAERVRYYDSGVVGRDRIRRDLQSYANHWPRRSFRLAGEIQVRPPAADGLLRVTFPLRYELQNGTKRKAGRVRKTLELQVRGDDLEIVGVDER